MEATTPKFTVQGTYSPANLDKGTLVNLILHSNPLQNSNNKYVLIVLERSAFMKGPRLEACIEGISEVLKKLFANNPSPKVDLITFNEKPTFYSLQTKTCDECLQILSGIKADGVTCFDPVLEMIENILNSKAIIDYYLSKETRTDKTYFAKNRIPQTNFDELSVLFLSGGTGNIYDRIQPHTESIKTLIQQKRLSAECHALGLGADEEAKKLEKMMRDISPQGIFQYIKKTNEIPMGFEAVSEFLLEKKIKAVVKYQEKRPRQKKIDFVSHKRNIEDPDMKSCWEAVISLNMSVKDFEAVKDSFKLCVKFEEKEITLDVPLVAQKAEEEIIKTSS